MGVGYHHYALRRPIHVFHDDLLRNTILVLVQTSEYIYRYIYMLYK